MFGGNLSIHPGTADALGSHVDSHFLALALHGQQRLWIHLVCEKDALRVVLRFSLVNERFILVALFGEDGDQILRAHRVGSGQ